MGLMLYYWALTDQPGVTHTSRTRLIYMIGSDDSRVRDRCDAVTN